MQMTLQLPAIRSNGSGAVVATVSSLSRFPPTFKNGSSKILPSPSYHSHHYPLSFPKFPILSSSSFLGFSFKNRKTITAASSYPFSSPDPDSEGAKLAQVSKRLANTSRHFKRLGSLGFWSQLVCTVVAAGILSFSAVVNGKITSPFTFYATAGGIAAAFVSAFWSFGYIRLSDQLRRTANEPTKAPPRVQVVKSLKNGTMLNILGMGAAILGMQATVGLLVAKALTSSVVPYYQGTSPVYGPVLALDVFLVQASANTILSHFLGLVFSLELLRSVTLPPTEGSVIPRTV
ncbi:protein TIC 21, chloroplastic-like [Magnolia sinica]|uniref:protein TIC 21, chloroplastic-like n=1 Tax=Magnolia sinica TaxID=86752 RepID=UPI002658BFC5|nr:protein TIC 21, chloroplastic-like [Magnolia sinica]